MNVFAHQGQATFSLTKSQLLTRLSPSSIGGPGLGTMTSSRSVFILRDTQNFCNFSLTAAALGLGFYMLLATPALHVAWAAA